MESGLTTTLVKERVWLMTIDMILKILKQGDSKGSALKELAEYYDCNDYDLSPISNNMAELFLERKEREIYE